jgi:hypothetical protein
MNSGASLIRQKLRYEFPLDPVITMKRRAPYHKPA